jgi:hypothetical protein
MNCLVLGIALSMHVGLQDDYNQTHPYLMCETGEIITGAYYNSLDKVSLVAAKEYSLSDDLKVDLGLVTGYTYDVIPMFRVRYKDFFMMPALEDDRGGLVFGIQIDLN